jgi:D-alanyl-D-alanine carboxypeptidase
MGLHLDDDIPQAVREGVATPPRRQFPLALWIGLGAGTITLVLTIWGLNRLQQQGQGLPSARFTPTPDELLGHHAYAEAPAASLVPLTADSLVKLRPRAAQAFLAMQTEAHKDGVELVALSGYRSRQEQEQLFFQVKSERNQSVIQRADVSAPPGYSEHHTGYALDIGDATQPQTHVDPSFEKTPAFRWLQANAQRFNFELSFPKNNSQSVIYEPWHWRFVGDSHSLKTFYRK